MHGYTISKDRASSLGAARGCAVPRRRIRAAGSLRHRGPAAPARPGGRVRLRPVRPGRSVARVRGRACAGACHAWGSRRLTTRRCRLATPGSEPCRCAPRRNATGRRFEPTIASMPDRRTPRRANVTSAHRSRWSARRGGRRGLRAGSPRPSPAGGPRPSRPGLHGITAPEAPHFREISPLQKSRPAAYPSSARCLARPSAAVWLASPRSA